MFHSESSVFTFVVIGCLLAVTGIFWTSNRCEGDPMTTELKKPIPLPEPETKSRNSLEEMILNRRSIRNFKPKPLSLDQLAQLCWAGQGITGPHYFRAAPSAGALYPLELYAAVGRVEGIAPGLFHYDPMHHQLEAVKNGDMRRLLSTAALNQHAVRDAPVTLIITGIPRRTQVKYGDRGTRYMLMEAGHAAQNILLQAESLGLGAVPIGAFHEGEVGKILGIGGDGLPLYLIPVGYPSGS